MKKYCSVKNCGKPFVAKGWCKFHYQRVRVTGEIGPNFLKKRPDRSLDPYWFWIKVNKTKSCWEWGGAKNNTGYGTVNWDEKSVTAHVLGYKLQGHKIPKGLSLDHLCRNRACVRADHLEPVTHRENILRGISPSALHAKKTHCQKGHPFSGKNLSIRLKENGTKMRQCRTCRGWKGKSSYVKRKSALSYT